jgi:basic membrane protein A
VRELGVQGRVVSPTPTGSYLPPISYLARQRYDLVIGIGFLEAPDIDRAARRFPWLKFGLLDARREDLPHKPRNVEGTLFRTEQPSYLAGYLAARMEDLRPGPHVVSSVSGVPIPPVKAFVAGFQAGARAADPKIRTLNAYTFDFTNPAKCARAAGAQIAQGSGVVFDVAGSCGLGALQVAKRKGAWGIGVDIDQSYLGPFILTSVVKHLDVAVFDFAQTLNSGRWKAGGDAVFDLRNNGVGLGRISPRVPKALRREIARVRREISSGRIAVPATLK